jgi:NADH:ubiquinone oxidoreductase subunit E
MYLAKEPVDFIADLYEITTSEVKHAIEFYKTAA